MRLSIDYSANRWRQVNYFHIYWVEHLAWKEGRVTRRRGDGRRSRRQARWWRRLRRDWWAAGKRRWWMRRMKSVYSI